MVPSAESAPESALHHALGTLRDAVSAAQNFLLLLRSFQIASRTIASLIPEVRSSIEATPAALSNLLLLSQINHESAPRTLLSFLTQCTKEVSRALLVAESSPIEARSRLALEATFTHFIPCLDAVRELAELLALLRAPTVDLDLLDLFTMALVPSSRTGMTEPSIHLQIATPPRGIFPIKLPPHATVHLLRLVLGLIHGGPDHDGPSPHASLQLLPFDDRMDCLFQGTPSKTTSTEIPQGDSLLIRIPLLIPPTLAILSFYCERTGLRLSFDRSTSAILSFTSS